MNPAKAMPANLLARAWSTGSFDAILFGTFTLGADGRRGLARAAEPRRTLALI
jgi:hypothetical protein